MEIDKKAKWYRIYLDVLRDEERHMTDPAYKDIYQRVKYVESNPVYNLLRDNLKENQYRKLTIKIGEVKRKKEGYIFRFAHPSLHKSIDDLMGEVKREVEEEIPNRYDDNLIQEDDIHLDDVSPTG